MTYRKVGSQFAIGVVIILIFAAGYYLWPVLEWLAKAAGWV
jgi:hypothetical protein